MTINVQKINTLKLDLTPEEILALKVTRGIFDNLLDIDDNECGDWCDTTLDVNPEWANSVEDINHIINRVDDMSYEFKNLFEC